MEGGIGKGCGEGWSGGWVGRGVETRGGKGGG